MDAKIYDHFSCCETLARKLKPIGHTQQKKRFFRAFGIEDLFDFDERLSSVKGMILIAVDGSDKEIKFNSADTFTQRPQYGIIIAKNASRNNPEDIFQATHDCEYVCKQIAACLAQDLIYGNNGYSRLNAEFQLNGIGPIGDNFYGSMLSFSLTESFRAVLDNGIWEE